MGLRTGPAAIVLALIASAGLSGCVGADRAEKNVVAFGVHFARDGYEPEVGDRFPVYVTVRNLGMEEASVAVSLTLSAAGRGEFASGGSSAAFSRPLDVRLSPGGDQRTLEFCGSIETAGDYSIAVEIDHKQISTAGSSALIHVALRGEGEESNPPPGTIVPHVTCSAG